MRKSKLKRISLNCDTVSIIRLRLFNLFVISETANPG